MNRAALSSLVVVALVAADAPAQTVLYEWPGLASGDAFGFAVTALGDVDGDGVPDMAAGCLASWPPPPQHPGYVDVRSGADGALLFHWSGHALQDRYGSALASVGDVDGDGTCDVLIGAPDPTQATHGLVELRSGRTGTVLVRHVGLAGDQFLGADVAAAGDRDDDGVPDLFAGGVGFARVYSGSDGSILFELDAPGSQLGTALAGGADLDGDGLPELVTGDWQSGSGGRVSVWSTSDSVPLMTFDAEDPVDQLGIDVAVVGDVDADGTPDIAGGAYMFNGVFIGEGGYAKVWSGATGAVLQRFSRSWPAPDFGFGEVVGGAGDIDGDGFADVVVASPGEVFSGRLGTRLLTFAGQVATGVGDVDGDGHGELLVGQPFSSPSAGGQAHLVAWDDPLPWVAFAGGPPGHHGVPSLNVDGPLLPLTNVHVSLSHGDEDANAFFVLGVSVLGAPFKGGVLVPAPDLVLGGLPVSSFGNLVFDFGFPAGVPSGTTLAMQTWVVDGQGPAGLAGSNGVVAVVP
ncbi:MAG: FG-GAP repeat protein [Planctomycetes bacterium]|nr:FG-GAP repeat protein [Planctomycetota bacterium]